MIVLVRTDCPVFIVHASDPAVGRGEGWFIVDAPIPGALTLKVRPLPRREFIEAIIIADARVAKRIKDLGEEFDKRTTDRLEQVELKAICARRVVVGVIGPDDRVPSFVRQEPSMIVDLLGELEDDLGNWASGVTTLSADPFVPAASGP